jgi:hypothetical protein
MEVHWNGYELVRAQGNKSPSLTAVVRVREGFHLRLPDHEAHLLLIAWGICADPHSCLLGHGE